MNVYCLGVIDVISAIQFLQVQRIQSQKLIAFCIIYSNILRIQQHNIKWLYSLRGLFQNTY